MTNGIARVVLTTLLVLPLAATAWLSGQSAPQRRVAAALSVGGGMLGPNHPPVIDVDGDGKAGPNDQTIGLSRTASSIVINSPWDCAPGDAGDNTLLLSDNDSDGKKEVAGRVLANGSLDQSVKITEFAKNGTPNKFSFTERNGRNFRYGTGDLQDANNDGVFDCVVGVENDIHGSPKPGGHTFSVSLVQSDTNGDGNPDYVSFPWSQASAVGVNTGDTCGPGGKDPQIWIPMADTNGDGVNDGIVADLDGDNVPDADLFTGQALGRASGTTRYVGPNFPVLVDTSADGKPTPGQDGNIIPQRVANQILLFTPWYKDGATSHVFTLEELNADGKFRKAWRTNGARRQDGQITAFTNGLPTGFALTEMGPTGAGARAGTVRLTDANNDGIIDGFSGIETTSGGLSASISFVTGDADGNGKPDHISIPWSQASLVGVNTGDGFGPGAGGTDPQIWIPLADTNGDGTGDTVAFDFNGDGVPDGDLWRGPLVGAGSADLSVTKSDSPDPVSVGGTLTYGLTVSNAGPSTASSVRVTDTLPASATFVSATAPAGWTLTSPAVGASGAVVATKATMAVGESAAITIAVRAPAGAATLSNTATVAATETLDPNAANNTATVTTTVMATANLSAVLSDAPDPVVAGQTLTYTVGVTNTGPSAASGVQVTDTLPASATFVSATAPAGWTLTTPAVGASGAVVATKAAMAVGESAAITIVVRAPAGAATLSNTATVAATGSLDPDAANNTATSTTAVTPSPPTVTITSPTTAATYSASTPFVTLSGTASDATGVASVTWASDRGPSGTATGATAWTAAEIPLSPGANVITVTARDTDTPSSTATTTLTVTLSQISYYLAEGATGSFWDLDLAIANPNAVEAPLTITFLKGDATTVPYRLTLPPRSRTTIPVETIPGLENTATSAVVTSTNGLPLVVERSMFWDAGYYGSHGGTAVSGPATRWYFAEGSQSIFDTYVLLANANATAGTATVQFLVEDPPSVVTRTVTLPPTSRTNVVAGLVPELAGRSFSIVVDATVPIIAERAMYFGPGWAGGHESIGVTAPATAWFLAEGATGALFDTYVLIGNPNATAATVRVTYLLPSGQTIVRPRVMPANSRLTVPVELEAPELADTAVSTTVTADVPVIVERAMYWPSAAWGEAHNSFGVTQTATKWGLAEGRVGGPQVFATYILLANPNATAAQVRVTFLRTNGTTVVKDYTIDPTSRFNVAVNAMVPELQNEHFAAVIEVLNGQPIAVERAMYNNDAGGNFWAAGTNATAVKLP